MNPELIEKIKTSDVYPDIVELLASTIEELQSFEGLENLSNDRAGEEVKVRIKAANKLRERLQPLLEESQKRGITEEDVRKAKKKYALQ